MHTLSRFIFSMEIKWRWPCIRFPVKCQRLVCLAVNWPRLLYKYTLQIRRCSPAEVWLRSPYNESLFYFKAEQMLYQSAQAQRRHGSESPSLFKDCRKNPNHSISPAFYPFLLSHHDVVQLNRSLFSVCLTESVFHIKSLVHSAFWLFYKSIFPKKKKKKTP